MQPENPAEQVLHIGVFGGHTSQPVKHLPVPVGKGAVAEAVKDTQPEPRQACKQQQHKVCFPGFLPYPAEEVKDHNSQVEGQEEIIEEMVPEHSCSCAFNS